MSTTRDRRPLLHWPSWRHLGDAIYWTTIVGATFIATFFGANWITTLHDYRVRLHFDWELAVPFVPSMVAVYLSLHVLLPLAPFVLRTREELRAFALALIGLSLAATPAFLLFPADRVHPPPADLGVWRPAVDFARAIALEHNFAPSLHVAMAVTCAAAYGRRTSAGVRVGLAAWTAAVIASTLLLHQHYFVDVISGGALAAVGLRWRYRRSSDRSLAPDERIERRGPVGTPVEPRGLDVA